MSALFFNRARWIGLAGALASAAIGLSAAGCTTDAYCFSDCGAGGGTTTSGSATNSGGGGGFPTTTATGSGGDCFPNCGTSTGTGCAPTNGGIEICDAVDNDCDGMVDDGFDFADIKTCGVCTNNCYTSLLNCDVSAKDAITCTASANPGKDPGTCSCAQCALDFYDLDKNGTCEYGCAKTAANDKVCNNKDDDCDGVKDEDVDLCTSPTDCGKCGRTCVVVHGQPACVHTGAAACDDTNTQCQIAPNGCDCNGPGDCWWDLDSSYATGCEYKCDTTSGGVEICDGIDNDCDGKIDNADDLSGDANLGKTCFGGTLGECTDASHSGLTQCAGGQVVCLGANVLTPNQQLETCNAKDDDCDGAIDDSPTDTGAACGISSNFPCSKGSLQCQGGALVCIGAINPGVETCNGQDDDCDGTIDKTGNMAPADSVGACNVPKAPPAGATSPCKAGTKACQGGSITCAGSVGPSAASDACGVDSNCDGALTNQPNTQTDVQSCGMCGNNCLTGAVHANWGCAAGMCAFQGCQTGYFDLDGDKKCEYACTFVSAQEACNGADDNCNGMTDESVVAPAATQICGVSPSATAAECTSQVAVACMAGAWKCTFPAGVCTSGCGTTAETCDSKDNNCNGLTDENVANIGKPCASDSGQPAPGDGACRTTGTIVCNGASASKCSAVKDLTKAGPELCDGLDNDCDGKIDETFSAKGSNATYFVKPAITKVAASKWIYSYEASRPSATNVIPGVGNGYVTSAPAGTTLDKTSACSVPTKVPWFNVTGPEVEQTCAAMGGAICSPAEWQGACTATTSCKWGYAPRGAACTSVALPNPPNNPGKFCNLANIFDFDTTKAGDQDGLLATGSPLLSQCFADWSGLQANSVANDKIYDITGNLREITKASATTYSLLGGAFDSQDENGSSCQFTFYTVDPTFKFYDTGFRCCFSADPTL